MSSLPFVPPRVYYPRCKAILTIGMDDHVPTSTGVPVPAFELVPRRVEVVRNDARTADTLRMLVEYRDFPFEPRAVKWAHVSAHIENVEDPLIPLIPTPLNLRFVGVIDETETQLGPDENLVEIKARDYTSYGLDVKWSAAYPPGQHQLAPAPATPFPIVGTLAEVVEAIRLLVWPLTKPAMFLDPKAVAVPVNVRAKRNTWTAREGDSVWDVLTAICGLFGQVPVWNLDQLEIRPPVFPKPEVAAFFYGGLTANLKKLTIRRNYTDRRRKPLRIVAWDPGQGRAVEGPPYPPTYAVVGSRAKVDAGAAGLPGAPAATPRRSVECEEYFLEGTYTEGDLALLAQGIYTESAQWDVTGTIETNDLTDATLVLPLLGLSNGDPLVITFGEDQTVLDNMTPPEAVAYLSDFTRPNPLRPEVAQALVDGWLKAQVVPRTFLVHQATHFWDHEQGYSLRAEFVSYLLV